MGLPDHTAPRMLGRYALYEKIASGGMASVHIGRLMGPVGFARTVAIKHMHAQYAEDPEFVSMFLDEARLAARIRHPNVVPTLDVVAMSGELFLVMEFVQGESLSRLMQGGRDRGERIPLDVAAAIVVGALLGLHAAHEAKSDRGEALEIVHRDVSPHNILVGIDGVARVLDFGVAKAVGRLHTTREGQLKGKLTYMAPEQLQGEATRATDVYAASIVLWEALTGRRLFDGANERQVVGQLIRGCEEPPSKHVAGLASAIDDVTMRGLSMDPAKRFATAREMARALEAAIPLATPSKVGDWVELAATETLHERSVRVARIESDSSTIRESLRSIALRSQSPKEAFPPSSAGRTAGLADEMATAPLSGSSVSALRRAPFLEARRRAALAAGAAGLVLVIALAALASRHSARTAASGGTPETLASAVTGAAPSAVTSGVPTAATRAAPSAVISAAPSPDPSAATSAEPVASARAPGPAAPRPAAVAPRRGGVPSETWPAAPPATARPAKRTTSKDDNTIF